jgi:ureidoglycolate hydrolase
MRQIKYINNESFAKYGYILDFTGNQKDGWEILFKEKSSGFRIAIFEIERHSAKRLERHPESMETFEPISGISMILLADSNPEDFEVFLLDKPVCLKRGIWHEVITISEKSKFKIVENDEVESEFYDFDKPFGFKVDFE